MQNKAQQKWYENNKSKVCNDVVSRRRDVAEKVELHKLLEKCEVCSRFVKDPPSIEFFRTRNVENETMAINTAIKNGWSINTILQNFTFLCKNCHDEFRKVLCSRCPVYLIEFHGPESVLKQLQKEYHQHGFTGYGEGGEDNGTGHRVTSTTLRYAPWDCCKKIISDEEFFDMADKIYDAYPQLDLCSYVWIPTIYLGWYPYKKDRAALRTEIASVKEIELKVFGKVLPDLCGGIAV